MSNPTALMERRFSVRLQKIARETGTGGMEAVLLAEEFPDGQHAAQFLSVFHEVFRCREPSSSAVCAPERGPEGLMNRRIASLVVVGMLASSAAFAKDKEPISVTD